MLTRIFDHELIDLGPWLQPVEEDHCHMLLCAPGERLTLPKVFLGAQYHFGRSSADFDPFKCSFRFPLLLSGTRDGVDLRYVVLIGDLRGGVKLPFHRLQEERVGDLVGYAAPVERELSRADLNYLTEYLIGFLIGVGETIAPSALPFHRVVSSEFLVYGSQAGELFERQFESKSAYDRVVGRVAEDLSEVQRRHELDHRNHLLEDILRAEIRQR